MTYLRALIFGTALALAGCSNATSTEVETAQAASTVQQPEANWDIVAEQSHIRFTALQEGEPFTGEFTEFSGLIDFDPDAPQLGTVSITIPLASVEAGSKDRNSTLPGKVWFSTKAFPTAEFNTTDITRTDDGYLAKGELRMKGASAPVELPFTLSVDGDTAVMTGQMTLDRTRWDVGADPWNTDEWVSRNVELDIRVTARAR